MALELAVDNQSGNSVALAKVCSVHKGMAVACCCAAMATLAPVALVQLHIIKDLPDPPGRMVQFQASGHVEGCVSSWHSGRNARPGELWRDPGAAVGGDSRAAAGATVAARQAGAGCDHGDPKCSQAGDRA